MADAHIGSEFTEEFPTWQALRGYVASQACEAFGEERALQQILMADLLSKLSQGDPHRWVLKDSVTLPLRPAARFPWPQDFLVETSGIHPAYVMPRTAFDLDVYAGAIAEAVVAEPDPARAYAEQVQQALHDHLPRLGDAALGLGGLVHYQLTSPLRVWDNGQVMGTITAQPVDARHGIRNPRPVDDAIGLEIDVKPPAKVQFTGPTETPARDLTALALPGFNPIRPQMNPLANQIADKAATLTGPPVGLRGQAGAWHRYKDLFDLYYAARTCEIDGAALHEAVAHNWNWKRLTDGMPEPYRVYGAKPGPEHEPEIPWREGCEQLRNTHPQLRAYPQFDGMLHDVGALVDGLAHASGKIWAPGQGWRQQKAHRAAQAASAALGLSATPSRSQPARANTEHAPRTPPPPARRPQQGNDGPKRER